MTDELETPTGASDEVLADRLEFELRLVPGVINVSLSGEGGVLTLIVLTTSVEDEVVMAVKQRIRAHEADYDVELIEVETLAPEVEPAAYVAWDLSEERVALQGIEFDTTTGTVDVVVSYQDRSARGSATGGALVAGATATLQALAELGVAIPFALVSADQLGTAAEASVVVCLRPLPDGNERIGVARAEDRAEAAARATLSALNRHLGDEFARTAWPAASEPIG